jgi:hypothetical protein
MIIELYVNIYKEIKIYIIYRWYWNRFKKDLE